MFSFLIFLNFILLCESVFIYDVCPCLFAYLCPCVWRSEDKVVESSLSSLGTAPLLRFNGESRPTCSVLLSRMLSQQAFRNGRISLCKHDSALLMRVDPCNLQHNLITHKFTSVTHRNTHTHSHTCVYTHTHLHTHAHMHICMHTYAHMYIHVYTLTYSHAHRISHHS